jgi:hypothetical protein
MGSMGVNMLSLQISCAQDGLVLEDRELASNDIVDAIAKPAIRSHISSRILQAYPPLAWKAVSISLKARIDPSAPPPFPP